MAVEEPNAPHGHANETEYQGDQVDRVDDVDRVDGMQRGD